MLYALLNIADHLGERAIRIEPSGCTIGSDAGNSIRLGGPEISRVHVEIITTEGRYTLRSREEHFGTSLNGKAITGVAELVPGDRIRLGRGKGADILFLVHDDEHLFRSG